MGIWPGAARAALTLSFDDGYAATWAATIASLQARKICATYNVITGRVGTSFEGLQTATWANWREAAEMGHEIAAHGVSHAALAGSVSDLRRLLQNCLASPDRIAAVRGVLAVVSVLGRARRGKAPQPDPPQPRPPLAELMLARQAIEAALGAAPESFAYPAGRHNRASRQAVRAAGFTSSAWPGLGDQRCGHRSLYAAGPRRGTCSGAHRPGSLAHKGVCPRWVAYHRLPPCGRQPPGRIPVFLPTERFRALAGCDPGRTRVDRAPRGGDPLSGPTGERGMTSLSTPTDAPRQPWRIRAAEPGDAAAIVALLNEVYAPWGNLDLWRWKFLVPPASFRLPSAVAELDGRIVGHFGILPLDAVIGGAAVRGAQTVDAAVLPACRRGGIHSALGRYVLDHAAEGGAEFIYAFPGLWSIAIDERIGYRPVTFVPEMTRILQPRRALASMLRCLPGDLRALRAMRGRSPLPAGMVRRLVRLRRSLIFAASWALESPLARKTRRAPTPGAGVDFRELREFDERIEPLWRGLMPGIGLGLCKEGSYLNWRYVRHPAASYTVLAAERRGELLGFTVTHQSGLRADIAELVVHPDRADVADLLLAAAVEQTRRAGRGGPDGVGAGRASHLCCLPADGFHLTGAFAPAGKIVAGAAPQSLPGDRLRSIPGGRSTGAPQCRDRRVVAEHGRQ